MVHIYMYERLLDILYDHVFQLLKQHALPNYSQMSISSSFTLHMRSHVAITWLE